MQLKPTHATHATNRQTIQEKFQDSDKHVTIWEEIRDGHAPIFADAHRCASDAHNSHKPHQIVKRNQLFFTKIL